MNSTLGSLRGEKSSHARVRASSEREAQVRVAPTKKAPQLRGLSLDALGAAYGMTGGMSGLQAPQIGASASWQVGMAGSVSMSHTKPKSHTAPM